MLLEIDFSKKKKKPAPPLATVTQLPVSQQRPKSRKKHEHVTLSI